MWNDFTMTRLYNHPLEFEIRKSTIEGLQKGVFFNGIVQKNTPMLGYTGEVFSIDDSINSQSVYKAKCGNSGYLIDAFLYANVQKYVSCIINSMFNL